MSLLLNLLFEQDSYSNDFEPLVAVIGVERAEHEPWKLGSPLSRNGMENEAAARLISSE